MIIKTKIEKIKIENKEIYVKREDTQINKSFKIRGSLNFIKKNFTDKYKRIVIASSGNHGVQSSYLANKKGIPITVYLPKMTSKEKIKRMESFGANVIVLNKKLSESIEIAKTKGTGDALYVPPYDHDDITEGNMSVWKEDRDFYLDKEIDLFVPVGGGSIAASACKYFSNFENVRVITVETNKTNSLQKSIENGKITKINITKTIANGIATSYPGETTFPIIQKYSYKNISVKEDELLKIMKELEKKGIYLDTAGAVGITGAAKYDSGKRIQVALFSGGK
ncbi:MAG: pyridoxal-phosphate dependent enzyme [Mycoplasmatales bacterium]|nr:pyridoxal-phosphate dependent enzyme [Mycoplasmatales bacterium]